MPDAALAATQAILFSIGAVINDRYELKALLGEGGMGAVFRAYDRELDEDVALKVLHLEVAKDIAALTRFRREVKLARRVTHRNVARTFDLGVHDGARFLTMELICGVSLTKHAQARLTLPEVLRIAAEIARGLAASHRVGVVHRDLKPDNVMLSDDRVVLTDFGIARVADGSADVMRTGMVVGTPAYMAPEQLENQTVDGRTDVYAFGTMMFELLSGRLPFTGDSAFSLAAQRMTAEAPDLRTLDSSMPDGIATLVKEMLARRREERPDAQSVLDRIESLRGNNAAVGRGAFRLATFTTEALSQVSMQRAVSIEPLVGSGAAAELAPVLTSAIADALIESRIAKVNAHGTQSDLVVHGTLHASAERVRARLRITGKGVTVWAGHVDGLLASSLDLEDRVVEAITEAVRARASRDPGPADPSLHDAYEKARADFSSFAFPRLREAVVALEQIEAEKPGDPRIRALLANALLRLWAQAGARERATLVRAEELALRALEQDPTLADAHLVIAFVRLSDGELAAALRANEECLRIDPRCADAHEMIGRMMCDALHVKEGRRRLDLAARLEPNNVLVGFTRVAVLGLLDERDLVRSILADMRARGGPLSAVLAMTRVAVWWSDHAMALEAAEMIEHAKAGASWDPAAHMMRSVVSGKVDPIAQGIFRDLTSPSVSLRHRTLMHEIAADYFSTLHEHELAIEHVIGFSNTCGANLLWMDKAPPLALVRDDARFAEARARVAARCAELLGSVGSG